MSGLIPLEGGMNFRDIGGYSGRLGTIRMGRVFRSGRLVRLTAADRETITALGIRLVCDFRGPEEQGKEPNPWLPAGSRLADWGASSSGDITLLRKRVGAGATVAEAREAMLELYRGLPHENADRYGIALEAMAGGELPAILACTAGKDRTGMAVALLLTLVGVSRDAVIENYALSEKLYDFPTHFRADAARAEQAGRTRNPIVRLLHETSPEALSAVLASSPDYVAMGLDATAERYGSIAGYARERLGLSDLELAQLREFIIE